MYLLIYVFCSLPIYRINFSQIPKVVYIWLSHLKQPVYHNTHNETNKLTHNKEQSTPTVTVTENEGMNGETETEGDREPDVDDRNVNPNKPRTRILDSKDHVLTASVTQQFYLAQSWIDI